MSSITEPAAPQSFGPPAELEYPRRDRFGAFVARTWERAPSWTGPALVAGGIGIAATYALLLGHPTTSAGVMPTCLVRLVTGFDCPGCGGTRAAWFLLHGDLAAAARHHAPFVFAVPFALYAYLCWTVRQVTGWRLPELRITGRGVVIFAAVWVVFSVLRNLPWPPFTWFYI